LAVADGVEGVRIFDVTDAAVPRTVAVFDPSGARAADVRAIAVEGNLLAIADGAHGYEVVDITTPSQPRLVGAGHTGQEAIDVALRRGLLYVSHFAAFIDVYDAHVPVLPHVGGVTACDTCMQRYPVRFHLVGDDLFVTVAREGVRTYA